MKVTIPQTILIEALKRGALASLSDEAQTDNSTLSLLIKSVKIEVSEKEIKFESATSLLCSSYIEPVTEKIKVFETGSVMIPSKELYDWVNRQGDSMIALEFKPSDNIKVITTDSDSSEMPTKASIQKNGKLTLKSKDNSKTGAKWELDSYELSQLPSIDFKLNMQDPLFLAPLEQILEGLKYISFTSMPKDPDHIFDTISFQHKEEEMYMLSTDVTRCSLWKISNADKITLKSTITSEEAKNGEMDGSWDHNLLVPTKSLSDFVKLASKEAPLAFYRDLKKNKIYISQPGFSVRISSCDKESIKKYPSLDLFLVKPYKDLCNVEKNLLEKRLNTVALVNKNSILFNFEKDEEGGEGNLTLEGISETGQSPCKANVNVDSLKESCKKVWNVKHFLEILKTVDGDSLKLMIPDKEKSVSNMKISSQDKDNLVYFVMAIARSKYKLDD